MNMILLLKQFLTEFSFFRGFFRREATQEDQPVNPTGLTEDGEVTMTRFGRATARLKDDTSGAPDA